MREEPIVGDCIETASQLQRLLHLELKQCDWLKNPSPFRFAIVNGRHKDFNFNHFFTLAWSSQEHGEVMDWLVEHNNKLEEQDVDALDTYPSHTILIDTVDGGHIEDPNNAPHTAKDYTQRKIKTGI